MNEQILHTELWLPRPRSEVFHFFADARNLEAITPPWLSFSVLTELPIQMRAGARIDYKLRIRGFPVRWQTEITVWDPPFCFIDEQRRGPYRRWVHDHRFEESKGGTVVMDEVRYSAPGGRLIERFLVRPDVERIFRFRQQRLSTLFLNDQSHEPR